MLETAVALLNIACATSASSKLSFFSSDNVLHHLAAAWTPGLSDGPKNNLDVPLPQAIDIPDHPVEEWKRRLFGTPLKSLTLDDAPKSMSQIDTQCEAQA